MRTTIFLLLLSSILGGDPARAEDAPKYRTDANQNKSLSWFQPVPGQFPPEDSAHYVSGDLIRVDHPERKLTIRVDRSDSQSRALFDYPLDATMLPYGTVYYNNSPAALQDIPLGTHLHGWFYERPDGEEKHWTLRNGQLHNSKGRRASP
ncbi:MAG: hypothetical protein ACI93T_002142, partial [Porticoccaceae bacterium]